MSQNKTLIEMDRRQSPLDNPFMAEEVVRSADLGYALYGGFLRQSSNVLSDNQVRTDLVKLIDDLRAIETRWIRIWEVVANVIRDSGREEGQVRAYICNWQTGQPINPPMTLHDVRQVLRDQLEHTSEYSSRCGELKNAIELVERLIADSSDPASLITIATAHGTNEHGFPESDELKDDEDDEAHPAPKVPDGPPPVFDVNEAILDMYVAQGGDLASLAKAIADRNGVARE